MLLGVGIGRQSWTDRRGWGRRLGQRTADRLAPAATLWCEQDPESWWAEVEAALLGLPLDWRGADEGIGLAGEMHGATLLGADDDKVPRSEILRNDGRSLAESAELEVTVPGLRAIVGKLPCGV